MKRSTMLVAMLIAMFVCGNFFGPELGGPSSALWSVSLAEAQDSSLPPAVPSKPPFVYRGSLVRPPVQPQVATRPEGWPDGSPQQTPGPAATSLFVPPPASQQGIPQSAGSSNASRGGVNTYRSAGAQPAQENAQQRQPWPNSAVTQAVQMEQGPHIVARVGPEIILSTEVQRLVDQRIREVVESQGKQLKDVPEEDLLQAKNLLSKQILPGMIEQKLVYADARSGIPEENMKTVENDLTESFNERIAPELQKSAGVATLAELDQILRARGSSLKHERRKFIERTLAREWIRSKVSSKVEVSQPEINSYYQEHREEFAVDARAKWEEIMVSFVNTPDKAQAWAKLALLGNQIQQGQSFADVARNSSDGLTASQGGTNEWTTKGSLVSEVLDDALFNLPVGQLSQIIEDGEGFHIIRVTERRDAGYKPLEELRDDIEETLTKSKRKEQQEKFMAALRERFPVSTINDLVDEETRVAKQFQNGVDSR